MHACCWLILGMCKVEIAERGIVCKYVGICTCMYVCKHIRMNHLHVCAQEPSAHTVFAEEVVVMISLY